MKFSDEEMEDMQKVEDKARAVDELRWQEKKDEYTLKLEKAREDYKSHLIGDKFDFNIGYHCGYAEGAAKGMADMIKFQKEAMKKLGET